MRCCLGGASVSRSLTALTTEAGHWLVIDLFPRSHILGGWAGSIGPVIKPRWSPEQVLDEYW